MSFSATEQFFDKPVTHWKQGTPLPDATSTAIQLSIDAYDCDDADFIHYFQQFTQLADLNTIDTLLIGSWGESYETSAALAIEALVKQKDLLPNLRALFIGDISLEESEVSWIQQADISPIYQAFPKLEYLKVRGSEGLSLGNMHHARLTKLVIETGGMSKQVLEQARLATLPELTHLELWLGDENYGCDIETGDIRAFLNGLTTQFPKLSHLSLCNYHLSDEAAQLIAEVGISEQIKTLDLSKGTLSDIGAQALLDSQKLPHFEQLDLHFHYLSDAMMAKLTAANLADTICLDDQEQADHDDEEVYRYIFVSE